MKAKQFLFALATLVLLGGMNTMLAQQGSGNGYGKGNGTGLYGNQQECNRIPDLTDEQMAQIQSLRTAHLKDVLPLRNKMNELQAKQRTLTTGNNIDKTTVNSNIDEITKIKNSLLKKQVAHRLAVRNILTDDQKVWFDAHQSKGRKGGKGIKNKQGRGGQGNRSQWN
ncbi:MAG: Spy/CpxP family protein refolding chaperone [Marinilabiliaceae bacterium]|nr:Spy/CpxP family protein refolding chaperone [Marinilabiliaceae bacterium]